MCGVCHAPLNRVRVGLRGEVNWILKGGGGSKVGSKDGDGV